MKWLVVHSREGDCSLGILFSFLKSQSVPCFLSYPGTAPLTQTPTVISPALCEEGVRLSPAFCKCGCHVLESVIL